MNSERNLLKRLTMIGTLTILATIMIQALALTTTEQQEAYADDNAVSSGDNAISNEVQVSQNCELKNTQVSEGCKQVVALCSENSPVTTLTPVNKNSECNPQSTQ